MKSEDNPFALDGDISAQFNNPFHLIMTGIQHLTDLQHIN